MIEVSTPEHPIERARELFFSHGRDPAQWLPAHISRSWVRCQQVPHLLRDAAPLARDLLDDRREQAMRLRECAQPNSTALPST